MKNENKKTVDRVTQRERCTGVCIYVRFVIHWYLLPLIGCAVVSVIDEIRLCIEIRLSTFLQW